VQLSPKLGGLLLFGAASFIGVGSIALASGFCKALQILSKLCGERTFVAGQVDDRVEKLRAPPRGRFSREKVLSPAAADRPPAEKALRPAPAILPPASANL